MINLFCKKQKYNSLKWKVGMIDMINFIICDDNNLVRQNIQNIILKKMMKNNLAYKTHTFADYTDDFFQIMTSKIPNKIYILDIELPSNSGIDIARTIRKKDLESIIIFLTSHEELGYMILKSELMFLTFISKFDQYEEKLDKAISKAIELTGKRFYIKLEDRGIIYTIPFNEILYITKDSSERKTVIQTDYSQFKLTKSLMEIEECLDDRFRQTHRSCIVNMDRVRSIDIKKKMLTFDNGLQSNLLSDKYKKGLKING